MRQSTRRVAAGAGLLLFVAIAPPAHALGPAGQQVGKAASRTAVCVDHSQAKAALSNDDSPAGCEKATEAGNKIEKGDELRVDTGRQLRVRIINTNTALFDYDITEERVAAKDKAAIQLFFKAVGPYLIDSSLAPVKAAKVEPPTSPPDLAAATSAYEGARGDLKSQLRTLDARIDDLRRTESERSQAAAGIAANPPDGAKALLTRLASAGLVAEVDPETTAPTDPCDERWPNVRLVSLPPREEKNVPAEKRTLPDAYQELAAALENLRSRKDTLVQILKDMGASVSAHEIAEADTDMVAAARSALADQSTLLASAYALESLVRQSVNASDQYCWTGPVVHAAHGHALSIALTPLNGSEASRFATQDPYRLSVEIQPRPIARPAVGLSLMYAKKSVFPTYDTKALGEKSFTPTESGQQDARLTYGLTLGLSWRSLEKQLPHGWAIWFPELSVNADSDSRGIGVGAGLSWKALKIGAGWVWTKHTVLDGQQVGTTILQSEGELKTTSTYKDGTFYVSISFIGWQPFVAE